MPTTTAAGDRWRALLAERALEAYVGATCAVGVLVLVVMALLAPGQTAQPALVLLVLALCVFADLPLLETRIGHNRESFTFAELSVVLAVALVPVPYAVVLAATCVFVFHLARRIQLHKAAFNAANFAVAIAAAAGAAHLVADRPLAEPSARGTVALVLATLVYFGINSGGVALAVALSQRTSFAAVYRTGLGMRVTVAVGNAVMALLMLAMAAWSLSTVVVLPPVLAAMYAAYRAYLHAAAERDTWQQLESATRELNQLDETAVVSAVIAHSAQMFKADRVNLALSAGAGRGPALYTGDASGLLACGTADAGGLDAEDGSFMVYAMPLEGPQGRLGVLRLGFRGPVELRRRELQVLKTFTHSVSTTLQNARLYTAMRTHAEAKAHEASHDALTGLGNRVLLHDRAREVLAATDAAEGHCALLIVDLDHFKEINDTLGHAAGDLLLAEVARRIATAVPQAAAVCRLGGDEFAVLLGGLQAASEADALAADLLGLLAQPVSFDGLRLSIEGSAGVASYPEDADCFEDLLKRADVALYQAKTARGSFAHYRAERDESSLHRLALAAELRTALTSDQLVVHYQPQYDLRSRALTGAEALVRWQHPRRGLLAPAHFVSAVEHSGLIRDFTLAVLEKAAAEAASWPAAPAALTVAVNLSARNLLDRDLPADVARVLGRHGLAPERLVLEITETTMMSELDVVEEVLGDLRRLGVQLSVDDFGTGYSSLAFLQRVQVNEVKIDRSFVRGLATSDSDRALVRATVQLAHSLGARAVGEGVEDEALAVLLRDNGCDAAQGFHLGRPLTSGGLHVLLAGPAATAGPPGPRVEPDPRHLRAVATSR